VTNTTAAPAQRPATDNGIASSAVAPQDAPPAQTSALSASAATLSPLAPLVALCAVARYHQTAADPATLAHQMGLSANDTLTTDDLLRAAQHLGLKAKLSKTTADRLALTPLPALALMRSADGSQSDSLNLVILAQCDGNRVLYQDLSTGGSAPTIEPLDVFAQHWTGSLILITSRASQAGALAKFDFSWFVPALVKYRKLLGEVLLISFMLQLFGLVSPLFFQVVMDKVLVSKGLTTLDVLVIGLVVVVVFESVLNALRSYVFSHTTSRIDVELGSKLFRHLVQLPWPTSKPVMWVAR
jgi:ATP-binding cassette, subfamily B, bacterial HlyB/CyaB